MTESVGIPLIGDGWATGSTRSTMMKIETSMIGWFWWPHFKFLIQNLRVVHSKSGRAINASINHRFGHLWMTQSDSKVFKIDICISKQLHKFSISQRGKYLDNRRGMRPWTVMDMVSCFESKKRHCDLPNHSFPLHLYGQPLNKHNVCMAKKAILRDDLHIRFDHTDEMFMYTISSKLVVQKGSTSLFIVISHVSITYEPTLLKPVCWTCHPLSPPSNVKQSGESILENVRPPSSSVRDKDLWLFATFCLMNRNAQLQVSAMIRNSEPPFRDAAQTHKI